MFSKFLEFNSEMNNLLYYAFDVDDNLLYMNTVIHMENLINNQWIPVDVSTSRFAEVRDDKNNWRIIDNDPEKAFSEFRDNGPRGENAFLEDVIESVSSKKLGPSWYDFIECLCSGSIFAIITARGHESPSIRKGIEWIIDNVLNEEQINIMYNNLLKFAYLFKSKNSYDRILKGVPSKNEIFISYLDNCDLVGVSSPSRGGSPSNPEKAKEEALIEFKHKINKFASNIGYKAKIGFSDDDLKNVKHIEDLIDNLKHEQFPNIIEYVVKNTKNPSSVTKKVRTIGESNQTQGLESSVLKFTEFGNMTGHLYPKGPDARQDDYNNKFKREVEYLSKTSKEILGNKKKKKMKKSPK